MRARRVLIFRTNSKPRVREEQSSGRGGTERRRTKGGAEVDRGPKRMGRQLNALRGGGGGGLGHRDGGGAEGRWASEWWSRGGGRREGEASSADPLRSYVLGIEEEFFLFGNESL
ncbi:unnamed protein product [Dovyalis caffra]|uniref:Uncharacterized protein n=1 Tax=Dovyalis caffra TaxID=77055 RepID=A0AAV1R4H2_9ROSI|nr:unnamed protein product [Dovyalis caffra]